MKPTVKVSWSGGKDSTCAVLLHFEAWDDGRTSKTADGSIKPWKYCELVEEEE